MSQRSRTEIARRLLNQIDTHGAVVVRGMQAVQALRHAIELLTDGGRLALTFDPESDPTLRDYLAGAASSGLEGMLAGGAIGLLIGILVERPAEGLAMGMGMGVAAGAIAGIGQVHAGWRLRATWTADSPVVEVWRS